MLYDVYPLYSNGQRMPGERAAQLGVRGELLKYGLVWDVVDAKKFSLLRPLDRCKRYRHPDLEGAFIIAGVEQCGSTNPKSRRWWNAHQQWLCVPAPSIDAEFQKK